MDDPPPDDAADETPLTGPVLADPVPLAALPDPLAHRTAYGGDTGYVFGGCAPQFDLEHANTGRYVLAGHGGHALGCTETDRIVAHDVLIIGPAQIPVQRHPGRPGRQVVERHVESALTGSVSLDHPVHIGYQATDFPGIAAE